MSSPWRPLLAGTAKAAAQRTIAAIADQLTRTSDDDPSLARGAAGRALFFHRAGRADQAAAALDQALDGVASRPLGADLFAGSTGVAFVVEHIGPDEDLVGELDEVLLDALAAPWRGDFDLIGGLAGIGVYALERLRRERPRARAILSAVVERLAERAEPEGGGLAWRSREAHFDLGVAHGTPALIPVLAAAARHGVAAAPALLAGARTFVLSHAHALPYVVGGPRARSAWCYGEPGVAAALLTHDPPRALALGRRATVRPRAECGVTGAGLCHGAAGLGHIYNRLWQASGEAIFAEAASTWLTRALAREGDDDGSWLEGAAGLGLALLAATSEVEPGWDRALAVSC